MNVMPQIEESNAIIGDLSRLMLLMFVNVVKGGISAK